MQLKDGIRCKKVTFLVTSSESDGLRDAQAMEKEEDELVALPGIRTRV
jgi:hypothetical protein